MGFMDGFSKILPLGMGAIGGAIGGMTGGPVGAMAGAGLGYGFFSQIENQRYMRNLQSEMLSREDNAIRRRVADLKAAGLSPVLAAGQGADAGPVVKSEPADLSGLASSAMALMQMDKSMQMTDQQIELNKMQMTKLDVDTKLSYQEILKKEAETAQTKTRTAMDAFDLMVMNKTGFGRNSSQAGRMIQDLFSGSFIEGTWLDSAVKDVFKKMQKPGTKPMTEEEVRQRINDELKLKQKKVKTATGVKG